MEPEEPAVPLRVWGFVAVCAAALVVAIAALLALDIL